MRSAKYLNAREYAERLRLSTNFDVQDFAEDFLDALDDREDAEAIETKIDEFCGDRPKDESYVDNVDWLGRGSDKLNEIEDLIKEKCPEFPEDMDTLEIVEAMISRLRPVQEYDL